MCLWGQNSRTDTKCTFPTTTHVQNAVGAAARGYSRLMPEGNVSATIESRVSSPHSFPMSTDTLVVQWWSKALYADSMKGQMKQMKGSNVRPYSVRE